MIVRRAFLTLALLWLPWAAGADQADAPFTGPYGGGQMGYLWLDHSAGQALPGGVGAGGLHLGYVNRWAGGLLGGELEVDTQNRLFADGGEVVTGLARVKLRAGRVTRGAFVYGLAGVSAVDSTLGRGHGESFGLGAELPLGDTWRLGAELLQDRVRDIGPAGHRLTLTSLSFRASYRF